MTGGYLIIRTKHDRELSVAREIERMGFPAWVPLISYIHARKLASQKKAMLTLKSRPLMASYAFAAVPGRSVGEIQGIDGYKHVECHSGSWVPLEIPAIQLDVFKRMIDRENAITENQHRRRSEGKRPKRVIKLGPDALETVMAELFGIGEQEREAA